jgi:hypothetical protein
MHWVETVEAKSKMRFRVWSPSIWGLWTHYSGRTKPCFENHDFCEGGHDESTMRWYGYLFGWHEQRRGKAFVQLTLGAARMFYQQIAEGVSLRGMVVDVSRGESKKGPMVVQVVRYISTDADVMGQDCDPLHSLYRMWKVHHLGHAANLSLVSAPRDLPDDPSDGECLKTLEPALSFKEGPSASRTKKRSDKRKGQAEGPGCARA